MSDFPVAEYAYHIGRGTVNQYGYGLGARSRWKQAIRAIRRRVLQG